MISIEGQVLAFLGLLVGIGGIGFGVFWIVDSRRRTKEARRLYGDARMEAWKRAMERPWRPRRFKR